MAAPQKSIEIPWPSGGLSEHLAFIDQEQPNMYTGQRQTCVDAQNVRNYDPTTGRMRGASRAGHTKYVPGTANGSNFIQHINHIEVPSSISGTSTRTLYRMCVAGGNVYKFDTAGYTLASSGSGALSSTFPYLDSAISFQVAYFVDGANYKKWTPATNTVSAWTASAGSLPSSGSDTPRLICNWRNRCVLSGLNGDGQNWFMSALDDFTNFDYGAAPITEAMAVAGNNAPAGRCADIITALIPFTNDTMWFGGSNSIWQMTNDPMAGGRLDLISDVTGIAFGQAWCKDPAGLIYFFGSRGGLYVMTQGAVPQRLSFDRIENRLNNIDLSANVIRLVWEDRFQAVMIYVTPIAGGTTKNYVYDTRQKAFWPDTFYTSGHQPSAVHVLSGDNPTDRVVLVGCLDGSIRYLDKSASSDDGSPIQSYVYLGPLQLQSCVNIRLHELQPMLGASSDPVRLEVFDGASPEQAFGKTTPRFTGRWTAGKNRSEQRWAIGNAIYLKLSNNDVIPHGWQFEQLLAQIQPIGRDASRAF